jgi:predicted DNA-binding WGR domain protein
MAISEHVTEFAGFPVREYDPAVGILLPIMPRRELHPADGTSDQFWAITLEGDHHVVETGTIGKEGRKKTKKFKTPEAARDDYRKLIAEKVAAGFAPALPAREFELVAGKSAKFWAIEVRGASTTVHFGRIGTEGQTQTKEMGSSDEARKAYHKLIAEKTAKGYTEKTSEAGSLIGALYAALAANPEDRASLMALSDYLTEQGAEPDPVTYRVRSDEGAAGPLKAFLADPAVGLVQALVVGWCFGMDGGDSSEVVEALVKASDRLPNLKALFLGEITYDENEISWINQCDLTGLLKAFPQLEHFRARGGSGLALKKLKHENLRSLTLEASNLSRKVVQAVGASSLPALEHLELWLGTSEYGADTKAADLKGILSGKPTPALRYLGLRNSEIADDIARALAKSALLERIRVLDLSLGTLGDRGAEALLAIPALARLEKLDIHHHYVSDALVKRLEGLGIEVDASDANEPEDVGGENEEGYRYVVHSE